MTEKTVVVQGDLASECIAYLEGEGLRVDLGTSWDEAELLDRIEGYDALITGPAVRVTAAVLRAGRRLRVVGRTGVGVDTIDVEEATKRGVMVIHAPRSTLVSDIEQALAMLLACARGLVRMDADLKAGRWDENAWSGGVEQRGKTLGIVGLGASSTLLGDAARALGMTVIACDLREPMEGAGELEPVALHTLYAEADFIVVGMPAGAGAAGLVAAAQFAAMKAGVRLVGLGGPDVIDRAALLEALASGRVAAAALEVPAGEAGKYDRLARADNVTLVPRLEASTLDARLRGAMTVAEQVATVLRGQFPEGAVNVPAAAGDDAGELMPYMGLCDQLGRLLVRLAGSPVDAVHVSYGGSFAYFDTRLLTLGVLGGVLSDRVDTPVNFVNAQGIADDLGVTATEERQSGVLDYPRLITVSATSPAGEVLVSGTSLGPEHKPRLVRLFGEDVDIDPAPHMAFLRYVDAPGVGGAVGTMLGEWSVNIGHMSVGRGRLGHEAVMALTLDEPLSAGQVEELAARCKLQYARAVEL